MDIVILCPNTECVYNIKEPFIFNGASIYYTTRNICTNPHPYLFKTNHNVICNSKYIKKQNTITTHDLLEIDEAKEIQKDIPFGCIGCKQVGNDKDKDYCMNVCPIKMEPEMGSE